MIKTQGSKAVQFRGPTRRPTAQESEIVQFSGRTTQKAAVATQCKGDLDLCHAEGSGADAGEGD